MKINSSLYRISTADINSVGGDRSRRDDEAVAAASGRRRGRGNELAKKARGPPFWNCEMSRLTRKVEVEGHVDSQTLDHKRTWDESWESTVEEVLAEARVGPSRRVSMCVSMISGCNKPNSGCPEMSDGVVFVESLEEEEEEEGGFILAGDLIRKTKWYQFEL